MATALDFKGRLAETVGRVEESDEIRERNRELLLDFKRDRKLNDLKESTIERDLSALKVQAEHLSQSFDEMTTDDVKDLVEFIHEKYENDYTRSIHKRALRNLFKWMNDGEHPDETDWIQTYVSKQNGGKLPEELLTKDDIAAQIEAAYNPRDKALIAVLYETGARIGELIDLTVGDVEDRKHGKKIVIDGKTGSRWLPLVESVPQLNQWLNQHPNPEKDAPLWCKIQQGDPPEHLNPLDVDDIRDVHGIGPSRAEQLNEAGIETGADLVDHSAEELADIVSVNVSTAQKLLKQFDPGTTVTSEKQLGYRYIRDKILRKTLEDAGIDKPSNPHHYRHSRASHLATEMTEAELCEWFGWVQGSDVPAKYVHLSGRDIDGKYDKIHGLQDPDEDEDTPDVIACWRCEELNDPTDRFCSRCGAPMDVDAAEELEVAEEKVTESAPDSEAMLALKIAKAIREDPDEVDEFVEKLE